MTPTPDHTPVSRSALVVGGSGFIGSHLLDELALDHARLVSLDIVEPTRPIAGVEYERGDIRRPLDVEGDFDVVYNLAAVHRTPGHQDAEYFETNVAGASNVTSFCRERAIKTIVFASSISTYGPGEDQKTEDSQLSPVTSYGKSKTVAERIHREWLDEAPDHRLIVPRPAVTFGLGEGGNFDRLLKAMRQRRFVPAERTRSNPAVMSPTSSGASRGRCRSRTGRSPTTFATQSARRSRRSLRRSPTPSTSPRRGSARP
jgi:nucleoside-diphosphate-sugar epimerase